MPGRRKKPIAYELTQELATLFVAQPALLSSREGFARAVRLLHRLGCELHGRTFAEQTLRARGVVTVVDGDDGGDGR